LSRIGSAVVAARIAVADRLRILPAAARLLVTVPPFLGIAFFVIGLNADYFGWSSSHSYVTNTLSSLTGFCFGLPFVVLVLEEVGVASDTARKEQRAKRLTASHWRKLEYAVQTYAERDLDIMRQVRHLPERLMAELNRVYDDYLFARRGPADEQQRLQLWTNQFADAAEIVSQALDECARLSSIIGDGEDAWASVQVSWTNLDGVIKGQRRELLLPWLPPTQSRVVEWAFEKGNLRKSFADGFQLLEHLREWLLDSVQNAPAYIKMSHRYLELIGDNVMCIPPGEEYLALEGWSKRMSLAFIQFEVMTWMTSGIDLQDFEIRPPQPPVDDRPWQSSV
jgi:hypothetical protein